MLSKVTDKTKEKVLELLIKHNGDYETVARFARVNSRIVYWIDVLENKKFNKTQDGLGVPHLQPYIVATKDADDNRGWPNNSPKLKEARELYDRGLVELVTGRDGMKLILYAIPRRMPQDRKKPLGQPEQENTYTF